MALPRRPTTDIGTVLLHAVLLVAFVVLFATGLRIASDDAEHAWLRVFDPLLPSEHLFYRHMVAGVVLVVALAGYGAYIRSARLTPRIRLDRARLSALVRSGKGRWSALNVLAMWTVFAALAVMSVSGALLYVGAPAVWCDAHWIAMWVAVGAISVHLGAHLAYGGWAQITRIMRPARLVVAPPPPDLAELLADEIGRRTRPLASPADRPPAAPPLADGNGHGVVVPLTPLPFAGRPLDAAPVLSRPPLRTPDADAQRAATPTRERVAPQPPQAQARRATLNAHPIAAAIVAMMSLSALAYGAEMSTRQTLPVRAIERADAPRLDGEVSDVAWRLATPVRVLTQHGGDFGGSGESEVEIRAVHDTEYLYLAVTWTDPTRSLKHVPLVKTADGWRVLQRGHAKGDETEYHEDKFSLLLATGGLPLLGAAIHLTSRPLADKPASAPGRGLHYLASGLADVWQWRASHTGPQGTVENCHFGAPAPATPAQAGGNGRYAGGFVCEEGPQFATDNVTRRAAEARDATNAPVLPQRLPRDVAALTAAMGHAGATAHFSESEGGRWWMTAAESQPYAAKLDQKIPVGAVIPNVVVREVAATATSIRGAARWAAGRWTLEIVRRLDTGSALDVPVRTGTLLWVAAFDHSETRHTRHLRPLHLEIH